jgi:uncharacterized protein YndB with AHSA1/START domain
MQWWAPNGFTSPSAEMDFREGGTSLVCMRAAKEFGGQDMYNTWAHEKIVPMCRASNSSRTDQGGHKADPVKMGLPPDCGISVNLVTFKAASGNKTQMTVTQYDWTVVTCWT